MDINFQPVADTIASGTTNYIATFSPVFLLIGGLILAIIVGAVLISFFTGRRVSVFDENDDDDLYSR